MLQIKDLGDGVRCIGLNRPEKRNAIGVEMTLAIEEILQSTQTDSSVRAIVFHGIGGHFCAGMDLKDFFDSTTRPAELLTRARAATEHWRIQLLRAMPQPIVCAVQGYCLGGALPILAASRAVVSGPDAKFGLPEVNFGFVAGGQIIKAVGEVMQARALALAALTGRSLTPLEALQSGLVTTLVSGDPLDQAIGLARGLANG
jgi:enoyl-CoA hydratase/carnithine racemase